MLNQPNIYKTHLKHSVHIMVNSNKGFLPFQFSGMVKNTSNIKGTLPNVISGREPKGACRGL